jgi:hypothetical protein
VAVRASIQKSVFVVGQHPAIPKGDRAAVKLWNVVSGLAMIGGIVYAFFGGWYWALIGIVVGLVIARANQQSAAQVVAKVATDNPAFKQEMVRAGIVVEQ